jgi:dihydrofolate reductase
MQELLVDFITSLDGYGAAEGWPGFWGLQGPEYLAWLGEQPERDHTILMGANTYRLMSGFAAEAETLEADEASSMEELARTPKVVFSSTLQAPLSWPNTRLISGDAVDAVGAMKRDGTSPMRTLGSLTLCRSLLEAGLVDRFPRGRVPRDHWEDWPRPHLRRLSRCRPRLVASRTFDGRLQLLEYVPAVLTRPPGTHAAS